MTRNLHAKATIMIINTRMYRHNLQNIVIFHTKVGMFIGNEMDEVAKISPRSIQRKQRKLRHGSCFESCFKNISTSHTRHIFVQMFRWNQVPRGSVCRVPFLSIVGTVFVNFIQILLRPKPRVEPKFICNLRWQNIHAFWCNTVSFLHLFPLAGNLIKLMS